MEPKLILLNGPPAIGKSTMSQMYVDEHPMALNLDIDKVWWMMGQWQQERPRSHIQKMKLSYVLTEQHLSDGYDVIVAQTMREPGYYEQFDQIAQKCTARLYEFVLIAPLEDAIERCKIRGRANGYETGFRPGGILDLGGREEKLASMYETMLGVISSRQNIVEVRPVLGNINETYHEIVSHINN